MIDRIMRGEYMRMEHGQWDDVSEDAKDFVKSLLQLDPKRRPSAKKALKSLWMQRKNDADLETPAHISAEEKRLRAKRLAVLLVIEKISSEEILKFQQILQRYDPEETGLILFSDLRKALAETGKWTSADLNDMLPTLEEVCVRIEFGCFCALQFLKPVYLFAQNGDYSRIEHADFIVKALEKRGRVETERIIETLKELDVAERGKISVQVCHFFCLSYWYYPFHFLISSPVCQKLRDQVCCLIGSECNASRGAIPSPWVKELCSLGNQDGEVEIAEVLSWFGNKTDNCHPVIEIEDGTIPEMRSQLLATPSNSSIPGGRKDPHAKRLFFYDESSTSMRRIVVED